MNNSLDNYLDKYLHSLWITKGVSFITSKRLLKKSKISNWTISILSLFVIVIGLIPFIFEIEELKNKILFIVSIVLSIFILILNNSEASNNYENRAEKFSIRARKLNELYYELEYLINFQLIDNEKFHKIKIHYDEIIKEFSEDTSKLDFEFFRTQNLRKFKKFNSWDKFFYKPYYATLYKVNLYLLSIIMLIIPFAIAYLILK